MIRRVLFLIVLLWFAGFAIAAGHTPEDVVRADVEAQNDGHWDAFLQLRTDRPGAPERVSSYTALWEQGDAGIRGNVVSARLESVRQIPVDLAREITGACCGLDDATELDAFYALIEYDVRAEDKYAINGTNARVYILVREDDDWKIAQVSEPPVAALVARGFAIGSEAEQSVIARQQHRLATGEFVNAKGRIVRATSEWKTQADAHVHPSSITVAHYTAYPDCKYQYLIGSVPFGDYVRNVLPNEWPSYFPTESLRAGAVAAKMVGWYRVYNAKYPNKGYDTSDQDCDQVYRANSAATATDNAVCYVAGVGFDRADGLLFYPSYSAGSYNASGQNGGRMYQNGTRYLAENGYSYNNAYQDMVHYYYDWSTSTGSQAAHIFTYNETGSGCGGGGSLSVSVTSPDGGESWQTGTSHSINWSVTGTTSSISYWKVALSTDGGATWPTATDDPRQLSGGIFDPAARTWTWNIESSWNTSQARIRVRALDASANILAEGISPANFAIVQPTETISTPSTPSGPSSGSPGNSYSYSTGSASSSAGHSVQYQFDWNDGQTSSWLSVGTTSASHAWNSSGTYAVRARARCATHTSIVSNDSNARSVSIANTVPNYTLSIAGSGSGQGTVSGNGINCTINNGSTSGTCSAVYPSSSNVNLSANAGSGSTFGGWNGAGCSGTGGCPVTMTQSFTVTATFNTTSTSSGALTNGGFEDAPGTGNAAPGWTVQPSQGSGHSLIVKNGAFPHGGSNYAQLGGTNYTQYDFLLQSLTLPQTTTSANLTLWLKIQTDEAPGDSAYDFLWLVVYDMQGNPLTTYAEWSNQNAGGYFQYGPFDLTSFKGTPIQVGFAAFTDNVYQTTFFVDDVSLALSTTSAPQGYYVIPSCRLIDTRSSGGPLVSTGVRNVQATGQCSIPSTAKALSVNLTAVSPATAGFLTLYGGPSGALRPGTSTLSYRTSKTRANSAIVGVGADGTINVYNSGSLIDFLIDVNGYFQ